MDTEIVKKDYTAFIKRTLKALKQYSYYLDNDECEKSYDRTLFLNACMGLLLVPYAELCKYLPKDSVVKWGIPEEKIEIEQIKTIRNITRHMRNAIAHSRFDFDCEEGKKIEYIIFYDKNKEGEENFRMTLDFETFKNFILKFNEWVQARNE